MKSNLAHSLNNRAELLASWNFQGQDGSFYSDITENGNDLIPTGNVIHSNEGLFSGQITLDGSSSYVSTSSPVLDTDKSFSITAWVKLDSKLVKGSPILKEEEWARTAISQDCSTHSVFYLGVRRIEEARPDGVSFRLVKWSFTIAPKDGRESGKFDWCRANSTTIADESFLDKWVFLVGVLDTEERMAKLYLPSLNEIGTKKVPDDWDFWQTNGGLQIGRARWLGNDLDHWPGSIGPIRAYSGTLTPKEAKQIYLMDLANQQLK